MDGRTYGRTKPHIVMRGLIHWYELLRCTLLLGTLSYHAQELKMPSHRAAHKELLDYCDLTLWLKQANMKSFEGTYKVCNFSE